MNRLLRLGRRRRVREKVRANLGLPPLHPRSHVRPLPVALVAKLYDWATEPDNRPAVQQP